MTARAPVVRSSSRTDRGASCDRARDRGRNGMAAAAVLHRGPQAPAPMRPVALTSLTGSEFYPTFSPDGEQVAFSWNGTKQDNWDVYVTLVGSSDVRRLTSDPGEDARPTWSPDGRQIAFVRQRADDSTIHLVSPLGGAERRLGDFRGADSLDWSPDGKWLAAGNSGQLNFGIWAFLPRPGGKGPRGIYLVSVEGGAARPLIVSKANRVDSKPAFSPDGQRLAYVSCDSSDEGMAGMRDCDVALVELDMSRATAQPPRRLTTQRSEYIQSLTWTRDGSAIVYIPSGSPEIVACGYRRRPCARAHRGGRRARHRASPRPVARSARVHTHVARQRHLSIPSRGSCTAGGRIELYG